MGKLLRRTLIGVAIGIALYVAAILYFDVRQLGPALRGFGWWSIGAALALSATNYLLRFAKWELCLKWLGVREPGEGNAPNLSVWRSLIIYVAGLSMSVTPGKVGEVLRSSLLKASEGVAFARTAPVVVADRVSDVVALALLSLVGILAYPQYAPHVIAAMVLVVLGVVVLGSPRLFGGLLRAGERLPLVGGLAAKAGGLVGSSAEVLKLGRLSVLTLISVVGWGLECIGYWLILNAFPGVEASLRLCTFLWSATTIVGAISFLPGGLGATEGSLGVLVARLARGVGQPVALASTLLIRLCTLWFGELVGALALAVFMRDPAIRERVETPDAPEKT